MGGGQALATAQAHAVHSAPRAEPAGPRLRRFEDVVAYAGEGRDIALKNALERDVRLVRFEEGQIEFALAEGGRRSLANDIAQALHAWTGRRWMVAVSSQQGAASLHEQRTAAERERKSGAAEHPLVQAVLTRFPGAEVVDVRDKAPELPEPAPIDADASAEGAGESSDDDEI